MLIEINPPLSLSLARSLTLSVSLTLSLSHPLTPQGAIVAIYAICAILVLPVSSGNRRIAIDMADEGQDGPECEATNTRGLPELEAAGSIQ